ncbi:MAG: tetratricopeptide repeat protein, partial [Solirubrobacteraceae bacterium]
DLGWAGLVASLVALAAWMVAAAGVLGLRRRDRGLGWDAERVGMATLAAVVVVFGVHSAVDWTWFIPANAVAALICAGWIAGRPPLRARLATEGPTGALVAAERVGVLAPRPTFTAQERLTAWTPSPYRSVLALGVLLVGMAVSWTIVQPLRAEHADDAASNRLDAGEYAAAAGIATVAAKRNPLSVEPWYGLATARASLGDRSGTVKALARAVQTQPANAEAWRRLGSYELETMNDPASALKAFQASYYLDPQAPGSESDVLEAARATVTP